MDLKTKVVIEIVKKDGDVEYAYQFLMPYGSPLGQAYDVCHEVLGELVKMSEKAHEHAAQKKVKE